MFMMNKIDLSIEVEKIQIGAFDAVLILLFVLVEQITLNELIIIIWFYGNNSFPILMPS